MKRSRNIARTCVTIMLMVCAVMAACRKDSDKAASAPVEPPTLASRLIAMPPAAQIDTLRALLAADTTSAQLQFLSGNAYYSQASALDASAPSRPAYFDSAAAAYQRAVAADSTMSKAWVNMGLAYQDMNKYNDARHALESAIEVNPNDVLAYCHLGYLEHASGNLTAAMQQYKLALAIDPNSPQAHYNLGLAFAESKIFEEALREWQLVIKHDPDGDLGKTAAENVRIIQQYTVKP